MFEATPPHENPFGELEGNLAFAAGIQSVAVAFGLPHFILFCSPEVRAWKPF